MMTVELTPEAATEFRLLPATIRIRVRKLFVRLTRWPAVSGVKSLRGNLAGHYRMRTGDYRVQFRISVSAALTIVIVEKIGHRDGFYEE